MTFPTFDAARAAAAHYHRHIIVEIEGRTGTLEVWPGGRSIWRPADSKLHARYLSRLTDEGVFRQLALGGFDAGQ